MGHGELTRRLAELAEAAPSVPAPDRRAAVRHRVRVVRRRRAAAGAVGAAAVVGVLVPAAGLLRPPPADVPLATAAAASPGAEAFVPTFTFPEQVAVAELVLPSGPVPPGVEQEVVVRVRTRQGRVGGVDLVWGDGRVDYVDGQPRCTPGAGPTVVDLRVRHAWPAVGSYQVRASPQVLAGCRDGRGVFTPRGATPALATVQVLPDSAG